MRPFSFRREPRDVARVDQQLCACHHVLLLLPDLVPAGTAEFSLVEEAHHTNSTGRYRDAVLLISRMVFISFSES